MKDNPRIAEIKRKTADSFAYEWRHFDIDPQEMEGNFWGYFQFFAPAFFSGKRVLEVGPGMGRHTFHLARHAHTVIAADIGDAIQVTRKNTATCRNVHCLRSDVYALPFRPESFDLVCAIGVLPCVPDPELALRELSRFARPGGTVHIYVYWALEKAPAWQRSLLRAVNSTRRITTRLPYPVLSAISWVVSVGGYAAFSLPYRYLSRWRRTSLMADKLPLQRYAADGFRVCHNDQFDRLSAPIEHRHTRSEVEAWFEAAGFEDIRVEAHYGWIACGRKPGPGGS